MKRRQFLEMIAAGSAALALPSVAGCGGAQLALTPWSGPAASERDVRLQALSYAVLAPNAHNTQPWKVALHDDGLDLYIDPSRLLPATDPPYRQTHISQGTFLEQLVLAFGALGHAAEVTYFPEGEYGNTVLEHRAVAHVVIRPGAAGRDPLFDSITERRSNKSLYDPDRPVPLATREELVRAAATAGDGAVVRFVDTVDGRARLVDVCADAMAAEVRARTRDEETARWFRFNDAEVEQKRDGFSLAQAGRSGFGKWFVETFVISRASAADPDGTFAKGAVDLSRDQARSAPCFGALLTRENTRRAQVVVGRAYARVALAAAAAGVAIHPMSQALEEYADMTPVKARIERELGMAPGGTVQMFFRLGYAEPTPHTARREVRDLLA